MATVTVDETSVDETSSGARGHVLLGLFFLSGFAALVYQVLWVREIGLLVGSTAQAAALTIAIFFAGIATGGWFWGRRAGRTRSPLRTFGWLEVGVGLTALGHFVLVDAYAAIYPRLFGVIGEVTALDTLAKALIAALILLPPSFLMGGTLPVMGQHLIRDRDRLGSRGSTLYAVNTAGSAAGALAAGFALPLALGLDGTYLLAVGLDLAVGAACLLMARRHVAPRPVVGGGAPRPAATDGVTEVGRAAGAAADPPTVTVPRTGRSAPVPTTVVWWVAGSSGFATLAVEVVWTRLFAQVLQNSAYTYALVLSTFLLALSLGAAFASVLARSRRAVPEQVLVVLLVLAGVTTALSPWVFDRATDGLSYLGADLAWEGYVLAVAGLAVPVLLLPGIILGVILPYLLRVVQGPDRAPGETIGGLVAVNTAGSIIGSLVAGFVLLPWLGSARSLLVIAAAYGVSVAVVVLDRRSVARTGLAVAAVVAAVAALGIDVTGLAEPAVDRGRGERLVEARDGSQANVAIIGRGSDRLIRVNDSYTLGGSRGRHSEQNQSILPLLTGDARSVFYLGLGTGITAGAALPFEVDRVVACELLADVVTLAEAHFGPWVNGLFEDGRVTVHAEDGRSCLRRSPDTYDLIVSDLFTPWQAGTGNLYTLEHYRTARERVTPGGRVVQWIPLYQVSWDELAIIAATMDEAFPEVTMWRGDLFDERSIVALVGHDAGPFDPGGIAGRARQLPGADGATDADLEALVLRHYVGNVTASGVFRDAPINTDSHPLIEYLAPRTHREVRAGTASFLIGAERERLYAALRSALPVADDPYLSRLDDTQRGYVEAGAAYSRGAWLRADGRDGAAADALATYEQRSPAGAVEERSPARWLLGG
jgi:spermidine synthase